MDEHNPSPQFDISPIWPEDEDIIESHEKPTSQHRQAVSPRDHQAKALIYSDDSAVMNTEVYLLTYQPPAIWVIIVCCAGLQRCAEFGVVRSKYDLAANMTWRAPLVAKNGSNMVRISR